MKCNKCGGRVLAERNVDFPNGVETSCIMCGKRNFYLKGSTHRFDKWLISAVISQENGY